MTFPTTAKSLYLTTRAWFLLLNAVLMMATILLVIFSSSLSKEGAQLMLKVKEIRMVQAVAFDLQAASYKLSRFQTKQGEQTAQQLQTIVTLSAYKELKTIMDNVDAVTPWRESYQRGEQWLMKGNDPSNSDDAKKWIYETNTRMQAMLVVTLLNMNKKNQAFFFCYILIALLFGIWTTMIYHRIQLKRTIGTSTASVPFYVKDALAAVGK